jgi:sigma-E factor negative regulatory protein RseC
VSDKNSIEHKGFIERINGNSIYVKILSQSACQSCHAKGACSVSEMQEKEVEVQNYKGDFKIGETVNLVMSQSQGYSALLIAYIIPFILVFLTLLIFTLSGISELKAGLLSLAVLPPYYLIIYLFRNNIRKKFIFSVRKSE